MPKVRKEIPELEKLVQVGRKKFVRYEEGGKALGKHWSTHGKGCESDR